jgi:hypothetical protein
MFFYTYADRSSQPLSSIVGGNESGGSKLRIIYFAYGLVCYVGFLGVFLYTVGFVGNFGVPKSMDSGPATPFGIALGINLLLLIEGMPEDLLQMTKDGTENLTGHLSHDVWIAQ